MPAPTVNDIAQRKLALLHAVRAELNRKRYLEALQLPTERDEVLRALHAASAALEPGGPTSALDFVF